MEANDRGYWVHACRPSIAGKPATNGGQTSCITPGQDAKNRVQTIRGYQVHTWRHQSPESRLRWRPNTLHHARAGCQKSEANDPRLSGARMAASLPESRFLVAAK
ncbi:MAG: hypothetical protein LKH78_04545 [Weizmannia coagulans]|uniref:hypothetical protein n=1 Tax=Heyndrickxia TaxID=2837504 RepID=UPI00076E437C|nr:MULTISPECIES: hypothetical protein [Heyndrickxia]AVD55042.1 hypothetical protein C3766_02210 [Heyndrickxia coagulans]MCI1574976.1 hypothetical protein [Heyndrickxia coagulans]MED4841176.1 hypothetical protein [Weizmannia sp. CD-2023]MED4902136.1 hypothetical protein [Weizmannia sp. CD-2023]MED4921423.1 hypothetical protein [Weizmannia sp. CD-2023]